MIRGLALRSLTGLRLQSMLEYVMPPLKAALTDSSGYVRQAGVMGTLKVFHLSPETVKEHDFVDTLYNMLRDSDPQAC
jgi:AP-4 complex subunit beta-1